MPFINKSGSTPRGGGWGGEGFLHFNYLLVWCFDYAYDVG